MIHRNELNGQAKRGNGVLPVTEFLHISPVSAWRYRNRKWIETICIAGRHYVTPEQQERFLRRAANGEFAKEPHGACKVAAKGGTSDAS